MPEMSPRGRRAQIPSTDASETGHDGFTVSILSNSNYSVGSFLFQIIPPRRFFFYKSPQVSNQPTA
jgi:hypothetical protein